MSRVAACLWLISIGLAAYALFQMKYRVQMLEHELRTVQQQVLEDQEAIHVLQAEWSFLNQPDRIARLAQRHLELKPLETRQIITFDDLPERRDPDMVAEAPAREAPARETRAALASGEERR